ncbi:MAG: anhydro-N-acetylmuramic acid kinase, partial [Thermodesulfovibrionales bacterium]
MRISLLSMEETARIIGIMSGTSHDGVDAALAEIVPGRKKPGVRLAGHIHIPYAKSLRDEIHRAFEGDTAHICRLN